MCGILVDFYPKTNQSTFENALNTMAHRGPDADQVLAIDGHFFGHHRLSIIDLDPRSNQPFRIGNHVLVFNGEIYNYKELIIEHDLVANGASDTEVLLLMFIKYGAKCLQYLNGMFAFVIYNTATKEIFAARDRLGIKPLYYREGPATGLTFSSEMAAMLYLKPSEFDEFGLRQYKKLRMTVGAYTIYKEVKNFPPGSYYENGQFNTYWSLENEEKAPPSDEELMDLLEDAVRLRLRADVPLGTYLSGGLDSTALSFMVKPAHCWTVGFQELNEFNWSILANKYLQSELTTVEVTKDTFLETLQMMVNKRKEPLSVPNEVLIYLMTLAVKKKNTVVLSGEGADELFLGYDRIFRWANESKSFDLRAFDEKYSYGSHKDDEVLDFALSLVPGKTRFEKVTHYFQTIHLQGLLRRVDNSTMLCSVEARVPFVDHRLVEMMAGTPFSWRMENGHVKAPLKRVFSHLVPTEIINRKKVGFPVPLEEVFMGKPNSQSAMDAWLKTNLSMLAC